MHLITSFFIVCMSMSSFVLVIRIFWTYRIIELKNLCNTFVLILLRNYFVLNEYYEFKIILSLMMFIRYDTQVVIATLALLVF